MYKKLFSPSQKLTSDRREVLEIKKKYFSALLGTPQSEPSRATLDRFDEIPLPTLSAFQLDRLNSLISPSEVLNVIKSLKNGSSPGSDCILAIYYKKFVPQLSPRLVRLFNSVL